MHIYLFPFLFYHSIWLIQSGQCCATYGKLFAGWFCYGNLLKMFLSTQWHTKHKRNWPRKRNEIILHFGEILNQNAIIEVMNYILHLFNFKCFLCCWICFSQAKIVSSMCQKNISSSFVQIQHKAKVNWRYFEKGEIISFYFFRFFCYQK